MKKRLEVEQHIKQIIRDQIAINPIISIRKIQTALFDGGFKTYQDKLLDWYYVAKLVRKIQNENIATLKFQDKAARLVILREKYRVISEKLFKVLFYDTFPSDLGTPVPTYQEQIAAANMIMRWELAVFYAEVDAGVFNKDVQETDEQRRNKPLPPEIRASIHRAMTNWGLIPKEENNEEKMVSNGLK